MNRHACVLLRLLMISQLGSMAKLSAASFSADANWPQWRGPLANGLAPKGNPPTAWSETNNIKWKGKVPGSGDATPIMWNDQVFIQTAVATGKKSQAVEKTETPAPRPEPPAGNQPDRPRRGG